MNVLRFAPVATVMARKSAVDSQYGYASSLRDTVLRK